MYIHDCQIYSIKDISFDSVVGVYEYIARHISIYSFPEL